MEYLIYDILNLLVTFTVLHQFSKFVLNLNNQYKHLIRVELLRIKQRIGENLIIVNKNKSSVSKSGIDISGENEKNQKELSVLSLNKNNFVTSQILEEQIEDQEISAIINKDFKQSLIDIEDLNQEPDANADADDDENQNQLSKSQSEILSQTLIEMDLVPEIPTYYQIFLYILYRNGAYHHQPLYLLIKWKFKNSFYLNLYDSCNKFLLFTTVVIYIIITIFMIIINGNLFEFIDVILISAIVCPMVMLVNVLSHDKYIFQPNLEHPCQQLEYIYENGFDQDQSTEHSINIMVQNNNLDHLLLTLVLISSLFSGIISSNVIIPGLQYDHSIYIVYFITLFCFDFLIIRNIIIFIISTTKFGIQYKFKKNIKEFYQDLISKDNLKKQILDKQSKEAYKLLEEQKKLDKNYLHGVWKMKKLQDKKFFLSKKLTIILRKSNGYQLKIDQSRKIKLEKQLNQLLAPKITSTHKWINVKPPVIIDPLSLLPKKKVYKNIELLAVNKNNKLQLPKIKNDDLIEDKEEIDNLKKNTILYMFYNRYDGVYLEQETHLKNVLVSNIQLQQTQKKLNINMIGASNTSINQYQSQFNINQSKQNVISQKLQSIDKNQISGILKNNMNQISSKYINPIQEIQFNQSIDGLDEEEKLKQKILIQQIEDEQYFDLNSQVRKFSMLISSKKPNKKKNQSQTKINKKKSLKSQINDNDEIEFINRDKHLHADDNHINDNEQIETKPTKSKVKQNVKIEKVKTLEKEMIISEDDEDQFANSPLRINNFSIGPEFDRQQSILFTASKQKQSQYVNIQQRPSSSNFKKNRSNVSQDKFYQMHLEEVTDDQAKERFVSRLDSNDLNSSFNSKSIKGLFPYSTKMHQKIVVGMPQNKEKEQTIPKQYSKTPKYDEVQPSLFFENLSKTKFYSKTANLSKLDLEKENEYIAKETINSPKKQIQNKMKQRLQEINQSYNQVSRTNKLKTKLEEDEI